MLPALLATLRFSGKRRAQANILGSMSVSMPPRICCVKSEFSASVVKPAACAAGGSPGEGVTILERFWVVAAKAALLTKSRAAAKKRIMS